MADFEELVTSGPSENAPEAAQRVLDAAGLTPDEMRTALVYLCGYCPDGVRFAVGAALEYRQAAARGREAGRG